MVEDWISPKVIEPPQGVKILCFHKGDIWVGYRWRDFYIQLPYAKGEAIKTPIPQLWKGIFPPKPYLGKMLFSSDGGKKPMMDFDEWEKKYPEEADEFVNRMRNSLTLPKFVEEI